MFLTFLLYATLTVVIAFVSAVAWVLRAPLLLRFLRQHWALEVLHSNGFQFADETVEKVIPDDTEEGSDEVEEEKGGCEATFNFNLPFKTLFTHLENTISVSAGMEILALGEELCRILKQPVQTLRFIVNGLVIDPWEEIYRKSTLADLHICEDSRLCIYFEPLNPMPKILENSGLQGLMDDWSETKQKLQTSKKHAEKMYDEKRSLTLQLENIQKELTEANKRYRQVGREKCKLAKKHGDLANEFAEMKRRLKMLGQGHRSETKKLQAENRCVTKKLEQKEAKLHEILLEKDRMLASNHQLQDKVEIYAKEMYVKEQILLEKDELLKEVAYLRTRLKNLSIAAHSSLFDPPPAPHDNLTYRRPSSTPSETGNESNHSLSSLSDHSSPRFEHPGAWSGWGSERNKLTIIDDSHYANPTAQPSTHMDQSTVSFKDANRFVVPSFVQRQPHSTPKSHHNHYHSGSFY